MQPLKGLKVLDLSQFLSGPRCGQLLGDMGADVIKLETPVWGETMRLMLSPIAGMDRALSNWNRNKRGITLDLRNPKGREIYWKLVDKVDVVIENFAPGMMDKLGLSWEEHQKRNPKLIYCSITGFGKTGPYKDRVAFDLIAQASGGIMYAQKTPHMTPGVFFGDFVGGAYGALGILEAVLSRQKTGRGQLVDISMQDVMYFHNFRALDSRSAEPIRDFIEKTLGEPMDDVITSEERPFACWYSYPVKDGHVAIVMLTDRQWDDAMTKIMNKPDITTKNPKFANVVERIKSRDDYIQLFRDWFAGRTAAEVEKAMIECKIPCSIVKNLDQVNSDPQLASRDMHLEIEHPRYGKIPTPGIPIKLSDTPGEIHSPSPDLGQHNEEVYRELLGMSPDELEALKKEMII
jgi:crotonobetainyl-CoA:carnitine CoA-transferase CaiB-like acyl-CoA transferase